MLHCNCSLSKKKSQTRVHATIADITSYYIVFSSFPTILAIILTTRLTAALELWTTRICATFCMLLTIYLGNSSTTLASYSGQACNETMTISEWVRARGRSKQCGTGKRRKKVQLAEMWERLQR